MSPVTKGSPLGELHRCVEERIRVKVHIRTFKGLRGVCSGFVVAFDKFWNMVSSCFPVIFLLDSCHTLNLKEAKQHACNYDLDGFMLESHIPFLFLFVRQWWT